MTTAELQWRVRAALRCRLEAPPGVERHVAGQQALDLLRELERRRSD